MRYLRPVLLAALLLPLATAARADFHKFEIQEIFSNADRSVQFIELIGTDDDQELLGGHELASNTSTFTLVSNLPTDRT